MTGVRNTVYRHEYAQEQTDVENRSTLRGRRSSVCFSRAHKHAGTNDTFMEYRSFRAKKLLQSRRQTILFHCWCACNFGGFGVISLVCTMFIIYVWFYNGSRNRCVGSRLIRLVIQEVRWRMQTRLVICCLSLPTNPRQAISRGAAGGCLFMVCRDRSYQAVERTVRVAMTEPQLLICAQESR